MARKSRRNNSRHDDDEENAEGNGEELAYKQEEEEGGEENEFEEEVEEEEEATNKRKKKSKRQKHAAPVMTQSGQTEIERRVLRQKQRKLFDKMTDAALDVGEQMADVNSEAFQTVREENNDLWNKVRFTREAVLDGDNVDVISSRAARQVDQLISIPRYDANRLATKLRSKCSTHTNSNSNFDWKTFGREVGTCFNSIPSYCSFFKGAIDTEYKPKERKKPVRRVQDDDEAEEEEVGAVSQKSTKIKDGNKLAAVEKQLKVLNKKLKERDEEERERICDMAVEREGKRPQDMANDERKKFMKRIKKASASSPCAVQFVMNPNSFTQTVENIFGLSFMVKKGDARVGVRSLEECKESGYGTIPGPFVRRAKKENESSTKQPAAKQCIVSFNMQDWRALKEAYKVEEGDIPHRGKSKSNRSTVN